MRPSILTSVAGGVGTLRLNRGDDMNSLDADTARAIRDAVEAFAADDSVRVMVLAGEGAIFSAGGDFNWVLGWPGLDAITRHAFADALMAAVQAVYEFPKPSIARVHGAAVGGGVGLMLACDFAVASSAARFGLTSVRNGLLAGIAIPVLIEAVGPRVARQLLMHGGTFDAATALRVGLVDQVVEPAGLDATVATLAGELKLGAPSVQTLVKKLVTQISALPHDSDAAEILGGEVANQCVSEEALEGMRAFLDKRKPKWAV
ncbi:MAG: enoyl-CoA hydratase/isomerase family protein [Reyranella sp.]|uniref:enoyl-CoA hydratase/isomerase family protein n=1 Tax=Reyranella sp. TaxID=1929291 RepID=UPI001AC53B68|nr:enoyl-CoA hydratase-related protein [Reyranella sp.]MBN9085327.1 enoyl-CoA hydratase/isomerase family protein [Reyranella sp.]